LKQFSTVLATALCCLIVIALIEWGVSQKDWQGVSGHLGGVFLKDRLDIVSTGSGFDVLVLGDSAAASSMVPEVFTKETRRTMYNLGLGTHLNDFSDVALLEQYLKHNPPPESVIAVYTLANWYKVPDINFFREYFPSAKRAWSLYLKRYITFSEMTRVALAQVLPSFQYKRHIRSLVHYVFSGTLDISAKQNASKMVDVQSIRPANGYGNVKFNIKYESAEKIIKEIIENKLNDEPYKPQKINDALLKHLCETGEKNGVPIWLVIGPIPKKHIQVPEIQHLISEVDLYLRNVTLDYPGCKRFERNVIAVPQFSGERMYHPNERGAKWFTKKLQSTIEKSCDKSSTNLTPRCSPISPLRRSIRRLLRNKSLHVHRSFSHFPHSSRRGRA